MSLECKLEILEEKNAIKEFYETFDGCIFIRCLDNDIRDKIYNKFEHKVKIGVDGRYSYAYNDNYLCNKYNSSILIIAEKNKIKEYILNQIEDDEITYVKIRYIHHFKHSLANELCLQIEEPHYEKMRVVQLDIENKRIQQERENKAKAMNLIDELF